MLLKYISVSHVALSESWFCNVFHAEGARSLWLNSSVVQFAHSVWWRGSKRPCYWELKRCSLQTFNLSAEAIDKPPVWPVGFQALRLSRRLIHRCLAARLLPIYTLACTHTHTPVFLNIMSCLTICLSLASTHQFLSDWYLIIFKYYQDKETVQSSLHFGHKTMWRRPVK